MNDIRRTILWVIFGFSMVLVWDQWQVYNGHKATFFPSATQSAKAPAAAGAPAAAPVAGASSVPTPQAVNATPATPGAVPTGAPNAATAATRERVTVSTDVLTLTFDSEGGTLVHSTFSKYKEGAKKDE
ncbi:MAG: membrane protein insertase YidC, partial [Bacteroidia bacterium]|nr:membrane protein insertase YidC [Bacteroidia bacterium]